jgi:hypothetical protein
MATTFDFVLKIITESDNFTVEMMTINPFPQALSDSVMILSTKSKVVAMTVVLSGSIHASSVRVRHVPFPQAWVTNPA